MWFAAPHLHLMRQDTPRGARPAEDFNTLRYLACSSSLWCLLLQYVRPWEAIYQHARPWLRAVAFEAIAHDLRWTVRLA
jgi:hypothetical protein